MGTPPQLAGTPSGSHLTRRARDLRGVGFSEGSGLLGRRPAARKEAGAAVHRAALIRDHRRPRTASAWRPRALARRAALRWYGSFDSLCRHTPGGRGSQKWLRGPLPCGRGTASGTSSVATDARRAAVRRSWRWWFEVGIVQSSVDESRASAGRGCHLCSLCTKWEIYLFDALSFDPR